MRSVPLLDGPVSITGMLGSDPTPDGFVVRRLPDWTKPQITDPLLALMTTMPSGVRLEFTTTSSVIELDVLVTGLRLVPQAARPATFDLKVNGSVFASRSTDSGHKLIIDFRDRDSLEFEAGEPTTIRFDDLGTNDKRVEIWLPHNATVELRAMRVDDGASVTSASPLDNPVWVHYGSSISHCMEANRPTGTWPAVAASLARVDLRSLGLAGACHLDQFVARTIRDMPADLISLKVGINVFNADSFKERTFAPALHGFLDTVREGKPTTPILVVSPIICPPGEMHPGPSIPTLDGKYSVDTRPESKWYGSLTLSAIRATIEQVVAVRQQLGDDNLHYLNGLELFGTADAGGLPDDLHPSSDGYQLIGERFAELAFGPGRSFDRSH